MGICLSCEGGLVPRPSDLGLPRKFTVFRELGTDGEGSTYLMRERLDDGRSEIFVAKVLERGAVSDIEFLLRSLRNQCSINHVNIIRLLGVVLTPSHMVIKLEYAAGGELYGYISKQPSVSQTQQLSEEHARFFFKQLLDAVAYCHEQGVAHRVVELSRILIDGGKTPRVKLRNFELDKSWRDAVNNTSYTTMESALYMPPEMLKNILHKNAQQLDSSKSDVWSLGVVLFVMLLGRFPFNCQHSAAGLKMPFNCQLTTMLHSEVRTLLRSMEKLHRSDVGCLKPDIWGSAKLSNDCRSLLDAMFAMEPSNRIGLEEIAQHPWVSGPLFLEHAQMIAACWDEMDKPQDDSGKLEVVLEEDAELEKLVRSATVVGSHWPVVCQWTPQTACLLQGSCNSMIARRELFGDLEPLVRGGRM